LRCSRLLLLVAPLLTSGVHAATLTSMGTITFHGTLTRDTSPSSSDGTDNQTSLVITTTILPLANARTIFSSDVLDFFASYAKPGARLISVTYK
jgi:hypothetical protein